jgi:DNA-directed RNA polymerase subunit RPC12/RpoP
VARLTYRDLGQRKAVMMKDSVTHCPKCMVKTQVIDTRPHFKYGYPSKRRARQCPQCGLRRMTIEIPIEQGDKYFLCSQSK